MAGFVAKFPHRPTKILGIKGTMIELLLLDVEILSEANRPLTMSEKMKLKRRSWKHWESSLDV